ncbi:putative aconitate hydratase 1 [Orientia tsutsugamushi str. Gilliam]|uniref:aconitate hydratase n=1 Tax=Orientia tsutsugamushi str. Gilliam TaxID=1359184 RepID=A0A0F3M879_ORITS|nr:putative aconitate hydratase 1 [Orientia tsutsugamushi str. Gilliam]
MQDYTGAPSLVDLGSMRDTVAHTGGDINKINPLIPIDLIIDHSIQVDVYDTNYAKQKNTELKLNATLKDMNF